MLYNRWTVFLLSVAALLFLWPGSSYGAPPGIGSSRGTYNINPRPNPGSSNRDGSSGHGGSDSPFSSRDSSRHSSTTSLSSYSSSSSRGSFASGSGRSWPPSFDDAVFPGRNPGPPPAYSQRPRLLRSGPAGAPPRNFDPPPPYDDGKDAKSKVDGMRRLWFCISRSWGQLKSKTIEPITFELRYEQDV
ncbi:hypothetical protein L249_5246 [Ophiocordyceps polyrhachis-furcata BCC 54312]|uniref:Uncharacterized protein n=1 Tax=Ophiocordyceps polyrhachis-furcata BCC 54312 TaxID=1330021 RepID=A0A367L9C4_9HYPO|nr:hypothetical protein L249_5246 [Ophiocordyceps polyrhachis-furcata BCC 54312]